MTIGSFLEKKRIRDTVNKYKMLEKGNGVVVGLSGGPDSVCLFFVLLALQKELDLTIQAVHVNHMIRGIDADEDEAYVKELCEAFEIPIEVIREDIPARASETGRSLEEEARIVRYKAFEKAASSLEEKLGKSVKIAIAHNSNDNCETVLFHMARGTGLDGMCGIAPVRGRIIRPLLYTTKEDIMEFLESEEIAYCIDATNQEIDYDRNRIRHNILPELRTINERALEHVSNMTESLMEIQSYLQMEVDGLLRMADNGENRLRKKTIATAPTVIRTMALKSYLSRFMPDEKDVSRSHIDAVLALMEEPGEKYVDLPHGKRVVISYEELFVISQNEKLSHEGSLKDKFVISEFALKKGMTYPKSAYTKWFDCDKITQDIAIRTRKEGDYLTINRNGGKKLLKDYFINEKIPLRERDIVPLVCDGSHVLWAVGYRISEYYKITENTTRVLEVKFMEEESENE